MSRLLTKLLAHPLTRGLSPDDPRTTHLRQQILRGNGFLCRIYEDWYRFICSNLPDGDGPVLELGSGAGFLRERIAGLITSEVFPVPGVALVMDAHKLPFADGRLRAVVMTDVLHHLQDQRRFWAEAQRCLRPGGRVIMVEPWVTPWSSLIYRALHNEPLDAESRQWGFPSTGPLSGANIALPWILFQRDRREFEAEFAGLEVRQVELGQPFAYLVSGGVSMRPLMPRWAFRMWQCVEDCLRPWMDQWAMFAKIIVQRR